MLTIEQLQASARMCGLSCFPEPDTGWVYLRATVGMDYAQRWNPVDNAEQLVMCIAVLGGKGRIRINIPSKVVDFYPWQTREQAINGTDPHVDYHADWKEAVVMALAALDGDDAS